MSSKDKQSLSYGLTNGSSNNNVTNSNNSNQRPIKDIILQHQDKVIIGYDDYRHKFYTIDAKDRVHALILGETGSGKSETLKLLMYHNILRKEGFMLIDPHGMLARDVLMLLKKEYTEEEFNDKVIYINPEITNYRINPLQIDDYKKKHIVLMSFISALKNLYEYAWGDRLETILRNAIHLLMEADIPVTLSKIAKVLADQRYRDMLVKSALDKSIEYFWFNVYPNYAREAFTAVYNKLDKLLTIASVRKTFDVEESNIDIKEAVREGKVIIIDLSTGFSDDIVKFLASIFVHLLYVYAKSGITLDKRYYLYIDEAHLIATFALREVLNALRKFNVSVTLATQTVNIFEKDVQLELPALCRLVVMFRVDMNTAKQYAYLFNVAEEKAIYTLPLHYFYFYMQGEQAVRGLAKSYVVM
jgi:type IV secretory pathway VirB4 component